MHRKMQDFIAKGKEIFVGLEDSKKTWKICVRSDKAIIHETSMRAEFSVFKAYLKRFVNCRITVMYEAGFKGFNLYDKLVAAQIGCVVLPPHLLEEPKVARVKTDKHDARKLARLLESGDYRSCRIPDPERREDRQLCRTLNAVEKEIKSTRNRIRKLLQFHGIASGIPEKQWQKNDFRSLLSLDLGDSLKKSMAILLSLLETLWHHQCELRRELRKLCSKERYKKAYMLIESLPGIGWLSAIRLVLELGEDLTTFGSGKAIAAFVGLTGREYSSGERIRKGRITGMGNNFVRSWLIESAWVSIRRDPVLQEFYQRIWKNSGSKKKAIVAVARKLIVRLRACVIQGIPYEFGIIQ